jgi:TPR repeat protein
MLGSLSVLSNEGEALRWWEQAAELGDEHAAANVSMMRFFHRDGVIPSICHVLYRLYLHPASPFVRSFGTAW